MSDNFEDARLATRNAFTGEREGGGEGILFVVKVILALALVLFLEWALRCPKAEEAQRKIARV